MAYTKLNGVANSTIDSLIDSTLSSNNSPILTPMHDY